MVLQEDLQLALNDEWQPVLKQARDLSAMLAVAVTDREEVAVPQPQKVRTRNVSVLVHFVRIVR